MKSIIQFLGITSVFLGWTFSANATICQQWDKSKTFGILNSSTINEASGLAVSQNYANRLYHINDSGDGPYVYVTAYDGSNTQKVDFKVDFRSDRSKKADPFNRMVDAESLAYGPCYFGRKCLVVGDIGDNQARRKELKLIVMTEDQLMKRARILSMDTTIIPNKVRIQYPTSDVFSKMEDAEAMDIHPNGDLFIIRKENPARIFRLPKKDLTEMQSDMKTLEYVGEIAFHELKNDRVRLVTGMDISPDGKRVLILTYTGAYEFKMDLSKKPIKKAKDMVEGVDYKRIPVKVLAQQEAISYLPQGRDFIYDTEFIKGYSRVAPIMKKACLR